VLDYLEASLPPRAARRAVFRTRFSLAEHLALKNAHPHGDRWDDCRKQPLLRREPSSDSAHTVALVLLIQIATRNLSYGDDAGSVTRNGPPVAILLPWSRLRFDLLSMSKRGWERSRVRTRSYLGLTERFHTLRLTNQILPIAAAGHRQILRV
jgi:hypothetical protein